MNARIFFIVLVSAILINTVSANVSKMDRWELCTYNRKISMSVESIEESDVAARIGLKQKDIEAVVKNRLGNAGIFEPYAPDSNIDYLYVSVQLVNKAVHINVSLMRGLKDYFDNVGFAETWNESMTGIHGGEYDRDAIFILANLAEITEKFIRKFMRVNFSGTCNQK